MVLCLLALPVFAILGIFSLKYRKLTKDALDCLFRTVTLRKCTSGLDDRIRADITGTFLKFHPPTAKFFYKNYKIISWIILILFLWSIYAGGVGFYNYSKYGNCNGKDSAAFCVIKEVKNEETSFTVLMKNIYYKITGQGEKCLNTTQAK